MKQHVNMIVRSAGFYPLTGVYLVGVALILLVTNGVLDWLYAVLFFSVTALFALLAAAYRELRAVHKLVDGQRADLLTRIDDLTALMISSGVVVPPSGPKEDVARRDQSLTHG